MPRHSDVREADQFLARSVDWVRERLEGVPEPVPFQPGVRFPLRGIAHEIAFAGLAAGRPVVEAIGADDELAA